MGGRHLNQPVVSIAATRSRKGYWLVANDGGIFTFGDARFLGSMGGTPLNQPVVGIAATANGYRLLASHRGAFPVGNPQFHRPHFHGQLPILGIAPNPPGGGYSL